VPLLAPVLAPLATELLFPLPPVPDSLPLVAPGETPLVGLQAIGRRRKGAARSDCAARGPRLRFIVLIPPVGIAAHER
jgi:hypothetical protein